MQSQWVMKKWEPIFVRVLMICLVCTIPSCTFIRFMSGPHGDGSGVKTSRKEHREYERYGEWCYYFPDYIIPRICAYHQLYPERFKPIGNEEEIAIEGFFEFVKDDSYFQGPFHASVWTGKLKDPWGDPVHFIQDINQDGYIKVGGEQHIVFDPIGTHRDLFTNQPIFGIFKHRSSQTPGGNMPERIVARPCPK